jgi:hypothetical protein
LHSVASRRYRVHAVEEIAIDAPLRIKATFSSVCFGGSSTSFEVRKHATVTLCLRSGSFGYDIVGA